MTGEAELSKLKVDLDEVNFFKEKEGSNPFLFFKANIAHEGTLAALRQKHNNSMASLGEQIDGINKNKARTFIVSWLVCQTQSLTLIS